MPFSLRDIPSVMKKQNWNVGAKLLNQWFDNPAWQMTEAIKKGAVPATQLASIYVDTTSIKMNWVLGFARAAEAHSKILINWRVGGHLAKTSGVLQAKIQNQLLSTPLNIGQKRRFGDFSRPAPEVDEFCQVNLQIVKSYLSTPDDFYAAIGDACIKIAVTGIIERTSNTKIILHVDEIATYLRDTYDFNGYQPLGGWGPSGLSYIAAFVGPDIPIDPNADKSSYPAGSCQYYKVTNNSFEKYRNHFRRGRDFVIFSNLKRTTVFPPFAIEINA